MSSFCIIVNLMSWIRYITRGHFRASSATSYLLLEDEGFHYHLGITPCPCICLWRSRRGWEGLGQAKVRRLKIKVIQTLNCSVSFVVMKETILTWILRPGEVTIQPQIVSSCPQAGLLTFFVALWSLHWRMKGNWLKTDACKYFRRF